jgi:hypothetical protein
MDKKIYEAPEMEVLKLQNLSMICESYGGDPDYDPEPADE